MAFSPSSPPTNRRQTAAVTRLSLFHSSPTHADYPLKTPSPSPRNCASNRDTTQTQCWISSPNIDSQTAHISKLVTRWPLVLQSRADETLLPKLEFFRSIGVPDAVSAQKLSVYPMILQRSLEKNLIPTYEFLKTLLRSDQKVVNVFARAPRAFVHGCCGEMSRNIAILRGRGVPESSVALLLNNQPSLLMIGEEAFVLLVNRAAEMGFDSSKVVFVLALQVFANMSESTLKRKMVVYRSCGWSESDVMDAFLKHPLCMNLSEKKIMANMGFLIDEVGFKACDVARCPVILGYSAEKRMRPRWIVTRLLEGKGLLKKPSNVITLLIMSEEKFVKRCIVDHLDDIPQLLDVYRGPPQAPYSVNPAFVSLKPAAVRA